MNKAISLLIIGHLVLSCGKTSTNDGNSAWSEYSEGGTPIPLIKQIDNCFNSFSSAEKSSIKVYRFINSFSNLFEMDFKNQVRNNFVESNFSNGPISKTNYNANISYENVFKYFPKLGDYLHIEQNKYDLDSSRKKLDVCANVEYYKKNSFENAGLSISHTITQTYKKIKEVSPETELEPIELFVVPKINVTSKYIGGDLNKKIYNKIDTDNAFYHPKFKMISFLPESYENKNIAPLWEIPMVAAHEYGHHVFHSLIGKNIESEQSQHIGNCFNEHKVEELNLENATFRFIDSQKFTLRAMNEGYADLIAFYTNSQKERGLNGVNCFEDNRDVGSSTYGDGTKKYFSAKAQRVMDSEVPIKDDDNCNTPNFQRIHQVGASFAYIVDRVLDRYTTSQDNKLSLLLQFSPFIAGLHTKISKAIPSQYIQVNIEYLVKVLDGTLSDPSKKLGCSLIKEHFYLKNGECILLNDNRESSQAGINEILGTL